VRVGQQPEAQEVEEEVLEYRDELLEGGLGELLATYPRALSPSSACVVTVPVTGFWLENVVPAWITLRTMRQAIFVSS
jgi:hypothetical protein